MNNLQTTTHTKKFIKKWKIVITQLYRYDTFMEFLIVPSIFSYKKTLSYVPLLNYTDRLIDDCEDLHEVGKDTDYQIRVLNPNYTNFNDNDTVTMRLDIKNKNEEEVFNKLITSKCRNQIRKAQKSNLKVENGNTQQLLDDFYKIYSQTMHDHGTPVFSKKLFYLLNKEFDVCFFNAYKNDLIIASLMIVYDDKIALNTWAGLDKSFSKYCPNHYVYWEAIRKAIVNEKEIFDFYRSGYNSSTYKFKLKWGAVPIKIDVIKSKKDDDIYSKYSLASKIWKKLPKSIVTFFGPRLCKYLADF